MIKLDLKPQNDQLKQFGWIALIGFPLAGAALHWISGLSIDLIWILAIVGVVTFGLSMIQPKLILPLYVGLMVITFPIGFVLSWVLMAVVYFGLFTPVGLVFRLFGRDPLNKYPDSSVESYWHVRGAPREPSSYFRLY